FASSSCSLRSCSASETTPACARWSASASSSSPFRPPKPLPVVMDIDSAATRSGLSGLRRPRMSNDPSMALGHTLAKLDRYQQQHPWLGIPLAVQQKYSDDQGGYLAATIA